MLRGTGLLHSLFFLKHNETSECVTYGTEDVDWNKNLVLLQGRLEWKCKFQGGINNVLVFIYLVEKVHLYSEVCVTNIS